MEKDIYNQENLIEAFKKVKQNKGSYGIDKISITKYENHLSRNITQLERLLKSDKYRPLPVKQVLIPKPNGKQRPLGIPTVRDRIVQQVILKAIEPIFESIFAKSSFGFRPKKSPIQAITQVQKYLDDGYEYIVEADIKDFFGNLNQQRLISKVKEQVKDSQLLKLIWKFLRVGVMTEGKYRKSISGTPQGGVISPILANIYLNDFDHKIGRAGLKLVRYADDFVILCKTVNQAVKAMKMVREIMDSIRLELAEEKTQITEYEKGFDFLGYHFQKYMGNYKWPSAKAIKAFKDKIRHKTRRLQPKNILEVIKETNPVIRGWGNYFRYGNSKSRFRSLDSWIRMRMRSYLLKGRKMTANYKYQNSYFEELGLVSLSNLLIYQKKLSFSN